MDDKVTIRLSSRATDVANNLADTEKFDNPLTAAKFALGYALKNYYNEFDPATYTLEDSGGNTYNVGSVDSDRTISEMITALYPDTETPYIYALSLMDYGLIKIGEKIDEEGLSSIADLCK